MWVPALKFTGQDSDVVAGENHEFEELMLTPHALVEHFLVLVVLYRSLAIKLML